MSLYNLLIESRVEDVKRKFPELSNDIINNIISLDPTPTKKYIFWLAKQQDLGYTLTSAIKDLLINWDNNINRFTYEMLQDFRIHYNFHGVVTESTYKDINNYTLKDVNDIISYLKKMPTRNETRNIIKQETNKIFEGNVDGYNIVIVQPLSYRSSCLYGASTKWCTASKNTSEQFERYVSDGELYYIIFKDKNYLDKPEGKPSFKYAMLFLPSGDIEVYDEQDKLIPYGDFFAKFPGIRDIFKNKLPLTIEQILDKLSYGDKFGLQQRRLIKKLTNLIEDKNSYVSINIVNSGKIELKLTDECIENIFVDEDSRSLVYAGINPNSYHEDVYEFDSYIAEEDFRDGYVFYRFNDEIWDKLLKYFELVNLIAAEIIKNIQNNNGEERKLFEALVPFFYEEINTELRQEITSFYEYAMNDAINDAGDKEVGDTIYSAIHDFFTNICQDPIEMSSIWKIEVSIEDVINWYKNNPIASTGNWPLYKLFRHLNKDLTYGLFDVFEYYGTGDFDEETFNRLFYDVTIKEINSAIDNILYSEDDIVEYYRYRNEVIKKTRSLGIEFNKEYILPDKKHTMIIHIVPASDLNITKEPDKIFNVTITNTETDNSKTAVMSLERIINLNATYPAFDIIDEVYNIFNKIKH